MREVILILVLNTDEDCRMLSIYNLEELHHLQLHL